MQYISNRRGLGLLQLAFLLAAVGGLVSIILSMSPGKQLLAEYHQSTTIIDRGHETLTGFVIRNSRLPCADSTVPPDGVEDCAGAAVGALPWATMGLPGPVIDAVSVPLRYSVYRNPAADLAVVSNSYTLPGALDAVNQNLYDFCQTVANAALLAGAGWTNYVNTAGGTTPNVPYILASGGMTNSDGVGGLFDGVNNAGGVSFSDPALGRSGVYDDIVTPLQFADLQQQLSCSSLLMSMNYFADVYNDSTQARDAAIAASVFLDLQAAIDVINVVQGGFVVYNSIRAETTAIAVEAAAIAAAAACVGVCVNLDAAVITAGLAVAAAGLAIPVAAASELAAIAAAAISVAEAVISSAAMATAIVHRDSIGVYLQAADLRGGLL